MERRRPAVARRLLQRLGRTRMTPGEWVAVAAVAGLVAIGTVQGLRLLADARAVTVVQGIQAYRDAVKAYRERYEALPGDDPGAAGRWGEDMPHARASDGSIQGAYNAADPDGESRAAWAQLRAAKLVDGQADDVSSPANPFGGIYGFQTGPMGLSGLAVCTSNVPGAVARDVLESMGSGDRDRGDVRAIQLNGAAPGIAGTPQRGPVPSADDALPYVICAKL